MHFCGKMNCSLGLGIIRRFSNIAQGASPTMRAMQRMGVSPLQAITQQHHPKEPEESPWPKRIFSGIQPSGPLHLGNYLGAIKKWAELQNDKEDVMYCIADMHSLTMPQQNPGILRENIFEMAATILACGIDPEKSVFFIQSAVKEHSELCWILNSLTTMARLGHLPQYKEKTRSVSDVALGVFVYPVLQTADIMLYKSTHIPVGEDQVQHIQLAQNLAKIFNQKFSETFPICRAIIDKKEASRIRSLRDPSKKMSKSDRDPKATLNLLDEPDVIIEKINKAMTDLKFDVKYEPDTRAGISNLIAVHSLVTGEAIDDIIKEAKTIDTNRYKQRVGEAVVEHLKPIQARINEYLSKRNELINLLEVGADKARVIAQQTMVEVKQKMGLGAQHIPAIIATKEDHKNKIKPERIDMSKQPIKSDKPEVPKQELRVEKKRKEVKLEIKIDSPKDKEHKEFKLDFEKYKQDVSGHDNTVQLAKPNTTQTQSFNVPESTPITGAGTGGGGSNNDGDVVHVSIEKQIKESKV